VARFFRSLGHQVDTAGSGQEAVTRASLADYDVVMLDLRLPDMTGDEVLTELRSIHREPDRIVFITGDTQSELARSLLEAGGYSVVSKPFVLDELAAVVLAEST
jgi:DNA-binding response OmpR family regulator